MKKSPQKGGICSPKLSSNSSDQAVTGGAGAAGAAGGAGGATAAAGGASWSWNLKNLFFRCFSNRVTPVALAFAIMMTTKSPSIIPWSLCQWRVVVAQQLQVAQQERARPSVCQHLATPVCSRANRNFWPVSIPFQLTLTKLMWPCPWTRLSATQLLVPKASCFSASKLTFTT